MIAGTRYEGTVRGWFSEDGWGATLGFPGLRLNSEGETIKVQVLESPDLPAHWDRLDAFEGEEYARRVADIVTTDCVIQASIYVVCDQYAQANA
mgnify:CR=1 FL=1